MGLAHWIGGPGDPQKPLKMVIFNTFLTIFRQNGQRYRNLRDFGFKMAQKMVNFNVFCPIFKKTLGTPRGNPKNGSF